jgi:surface polysaccharide O-acyltransferase-like enzyme
MATGHARALWLDYLRSFITILVVAHHAALAYPTFAYFDPAHYIYSTAPIVDTSRCLGIDRFIGFNDVFFMALMFFISGLFVYRGLNRKGAKGYLLDRAIRLGIPFLIAELLLIPFAYLPSFYQATQSMRLDHFVTDYLFNQKWPVGPPWFIWLLLAFDGVAVLLYKSRSTLFSIIGAWLFNLSKYPIRFGIVIYILIAISLIPISLWVGQYTWIGNWGPFDFQLNRLLFYLLFFLLGSCLGATDWQSTLFQQDKLFGIGWGFWTVLSLICYGLLVFVAGFGVKQVKMGALTSTEGYFLYDLSFVASCMTSIGACLSFFKQNLNRSVDFWSSLSANTYTIYIVHYGFVTWFQFALLDANWPVIIKFLTVFLGAISLSWLLSILVRRSSLVAQVL